MKLRLIMAFLAICCTGIQTMAQSRIVFDEQEHDFGTFKEEDGLQTYSFVFVNKGTTPLILNNVMASCGCTTPEWTQKPIAPGEKGFIKVSYNPQGRPGAFHKTITVSTNAQNPQTILRISGVVEPRPKTMVEMYPRQIGPVRARSNHVSFSSIRKNEVATDTLEIVNDSGSPVSLSFQTPPPHLRVRVEPATLKPDQKGNIIITYDASKVNSFGFVMHRIYLNVDGKSDYRNSIGITATIEEDFSSLTSEELANAPVVSFNTMSHDFGNIKPGESVEYEFILQNRGKRDLIVRDIKSSCECTEVSPAKKIIGPNESIPVKVVFKSEGKRGRQNKAITVITNDPKRPTTILRISTTVRES